MFNLLGGYNKVYAVSNVTATCNTANIDRTRGN